MRAIAAEDIRSRVERDNPWWRSPEPTILEATFPRRVYFSHFCSLALDYSVRRAAVLLGPRRVGKTVMLKQLVSEAIKRGVPPANIIYASIDTPVFAGMPLERYVGQLGELKPEEKYLILFDEIQYLRDWETHLKDLVDSYTNCKFVATGSAAAALRLKSRESGAGRFSEFMLPPLTFYEFLIFSGEDKNQIFELGAHRYGATNIHQLNNHFINYLNYGGYPEAVTNESIRSNAEQFIKNDIIDKVLLKDLPSLYGISDIPELNKLFSFLAFNAGSEASLERISRESGLAKPTINKYIEYLESAFLIMKVSTVDDNCRSLARERNFKVYLNNPSMRAALFAPVEPPNSALIGHLAECAVFSQWQHSSSFRNLRYARWKNDGEVDVVYVGAADEKPLWIGEIKWSDRHANDRSQLRSMQSFIKRNKSLKSAFITSKTISGIEQIEGITANVRPTALYCYAVGRNITMALDQAAL
ncbi:MAG: ATP-binding protein [Burkholderiales bacterium]|nr:ATP-binding protein [Burkholderiales bacterium]